MTPTSYFIIDINTDEPVWIDGRELRFFSQEEAMAALRALESQERVNGTFDPAKYNIITDGESWRDYLGALATYNADPFLVETESQAYELDQFIRGGLTLDRHVNEFGEFTPGTDEFKDAMAKLDLTEDNDPAHIYWVRRDNELLIYCKSEDWEVA